MNKNRTKIVTQGDKFNLLLNIIASDMRHEKYRTGRNIPRRQSLRDQRPLRCGHRRARDTLRKHSLLHLAKRHDMDPRLEMRCGLKWQRMPLRAGQLELPRRSRLHTRAFTPLHHIRLVGSGQLSRRQSAHGAVPLAERMAWRRSCCMLMRNSATILYGMRS